MKRGEGIRSFAIFALLILLVVSIGVAVYSMTQILAKADEDRAMIDSLNEIQSELYDLMILTRDSQIADPETVANYQVIADELSRLSGRFTQSADELDQAGVRQFGSQVDNIVARLADISESAEQVQSLNLELADTEALVIDVQQQFSSIVDQLLASNASAQMVSASQTQVWRSERILAGLERVNQEDVDPLAAVTSLDQDIQQFDLTLNALLGEVEQSGVPVVSNADIIAMLQTINTLFDGVINAIPAIEANAQALADSREARTSVFWAGAEILPRAQALVAEIELLPDNMEKRLFSNPSLYLSIAMSVGLLLVLGALIFEQTRANLRSQEISNESNQEAILRLLDEISDLGEGDLTVKATVTEDFTGAIADSINFAVEQLRKLVARVASTAASIAASSSETRAISLRLSEASEHQAAQITEATQSISGIAGDLSKVSEGAEELAAVAQSSVEVAHNGSKVVQNTIRGMDNIREQIQDTSKRIKRLGESSQEIGDIVSLINEIADQTNILALNASIQAAMAGEAGRGFAVVADEIQGLAERAAASTKQIESLVKAIQSDTNEAVSSMEQTTSEVVRGAQLTNDAGRALSEIQSTSEKLAKLILAISESANEQSVQANQVSGSMKVIQDISEQTVAGTTETGQAIGELAELAVSLRDSIADFKLPAGMLEASANQETDEPGPERDGDISEQFSEADILEEGEDHPEHSDESQGEVDEGAAPEREGSVVVDEDFLSFDLDVDDDDEDRN